MAKSNILKKKDIVRMQNLRKNRGLSYSAIAARVGVNETTVLYHLSPARRRYQQKYYARA